MANNEMEIQEMVTEKTPVAAKEGAYHDDEADLKVASEELVPAADSAVVTIRETRYLRINVAVGVLAVIALVAALYLARAFFVPLLIGILASYTLQPGGGLAEEVSRAASCGSGTGAGCWSAACPGSRSR